MNGWRCRFEKLNIGARVPKTLQRILHKMGWFRWQYQTRLLVRYARFWIPVWNRDGTQFTDKAPICWKWAALLDVSRKHFQRPGHSEATSERDCSISSSRSGRPALLQNDIRTIVEYCLAVISWWSFAELQGNNAKDKEATKCYRVLLYR